LDYDETSTPWECRMGWAVDLSKPAFQGQAALATSKGSATRTLVSVVFPAEAEGLDGAEIMVEGKPVGSISMVIPSPALAGQMLGLVRIDKAQAAEGTVISAAGNQGTVAKVPVYDPERKRARN
jgi:aminomethyltransferase